MSLEMYRYYHLDGVGHLHGAQWFKAASDDQAVAKIEATHPGGLCEIWQNRRLVAKLSASTLELKS